MILKCRIGPDFKVFLGHFYFALIGPYHFAVTIYKEIILPEAVIGEFGNVDIKCYSVRKVESKLIKVLTQDLNLGEGEAEAIAPAYELNSKVLIDELKARKIAEDFGLTVSGTIGLLLKAEKMGLINIAFEMTSLTL